MGRSRCDPFDAVAISTAIKAGETTSLRAYEAYASTAARPYARASWEVMLKQAHARNKPSQIGLLPIRVRGSKSIPTVMPASVSPPFKPGTSYWSASVKPPNILTTTFDNAGLKVRAGALVVTDGRRNIVYEPRGHKPQAIVVTGWGGYISIEAMRFCTDYKIAVIVLDWSRDLMSVVSPTVKQSGSLIRAQAVCDPLPIAKALIRAKIETHASLRAIEQAAASQVVERLTHASSIDALLMIEAQAARLAWVDHRITIQWREAGRIPAGWKLPYGLRRRLTGKTAKGATDPINSMLNLALAVTIGRLTAALSARGLSPAIGFIHKSPRYPLSYDAIEPLRPLIEAATFRFIEGYKFSANDFVIENKTGAVKFFEPMMNVFIEAVSLPKRSIEQAVNFLHQTILQTQQ